MDVYITVMDVYLTSNHPYRFSLVVSLTVLIYSSKVYDVFAGFQDDVLC